MTGYTVHTGATEKFVAGWDQIFKKQAKGPVAKKTKKPAAANKAATTVAKSKGGKPAKKRKK